MSNTGNIPQTDAERIDQIEKLLLQLANKKSGFEQFKSFMYSTFCNKSFIIGIVFGVMVLLPFVQGEKNNSFRLPNPIRYIWNLLPNPLPNPSPNPIPAPSSLKALVPPNQTEQLSTLLKRLNQVSRNLQSNLYRNSVSAKAAVREATALQDNAPEWARFAKAFHDRFTSCQDLESVGGTLEDIISEISP